MKWYTCTPVAFGGGADFFSRDSGLLSRGFGMLGMESRAVMPLPEKKDDESNLVRTEYANLESSDWWRSLEIDGLVLYSWGSPRYLRVAQAVHEAGIRLVLNQDNGGLISPRCGFGEWAREQRVIAGAGVASGGWWRLADKLARGLSVGWSIRDRQRAEHLRQGDLIACISPLAVNYYRRWCRSLAPELESRLVHIPHPVRSDFMYEGQQKSRQIVAVGRWDDMVQKRPAFFAAVINELLDRDSSVHVHVVGNGYEHVEQLLSDGTCSRVSFHGHLNPDRIRGLMNASQVSYCPSAFESYHIASAEALCCGCSVVASNSPSLGSFHWFVSDGDGTLAESSDVMSHVDALAAELSLWAAGEHRADVISSRWSDRVHAHRVAGQVLELEGGWS